MCFFLRAARWLSFIVVSLVLMLVVSVTRLGDFWKFLATKFLAIEAQMIVNFLGYYGKPHAYVKTALASFWATFGKNLLQHLVSLPALFVLTYTKWCDATLSFLTLLKPWGDTLGPSVSAWDNLDLDGRGGSGLEMSVSVIFRSWHLYKYELYKYAIN